VDGAESGEVQGGLAAGVLEFQGPEAVGARGADGPVHRRPPDLRGHVGLAPGGIAVGAAEVAAGGEVEPDCEDVKREGVKREGVKREGVKREGVRRIAGCVFRCMGRG
jgi:hypothetical protein